MNKLFHVLNIFLFSFGITLFIFGSHVVVYAADSGFTPFVNTGSISVETFDTLGNRENYLNGSPYGAYYINQQGSWYYIYCIIFNIDNPVVYNGNFYNSSNTSYSYNFNGVNHTVYYTVKYIDTRDYSISGTRLINNFNSNASSREAVCNYFLFGVGSLDYELPQLDIEDSDLDITGLSCYILNDQTASLDLKESLRNTFYGFTQYYFNVLTDGIFSDSFLPPILDESPLTGSIVNYVPGVALSWVSPSLDPDITYTVWVDGKSTVNYKTSADPIVNFVADLKPATSVSYAKLKINESSLSQSGNSFYQYNTNQGFETILNYIETNGSITPPSTPWQRYSYIGLDTKISRVYIQASKIIDGNNHIGALSYVDIIDGMPSVHEGVTNIDDVTASDPDTGTGNNVGTPYNVSGDTIYMGDTINNGDTYNIYGGSGLVVSGGNPLNTVKTLFNAIFKLVQALYLTKLIKWILIGFTGNPLGDFIL